MKKQTLKIGFIALFISILLLSAAFAESTGILNGRVTDLKSKKTIKGAVIEFAEINLKTKTLKNGTYTFKKVPFGEYTIRVSAKGYYPKVIENVKISKKEQVLNFQLENKPEEKKDKLVQISIESLKTSSPAPKPQMSPPPPPIPTPVPEPSPEPTGTRPTGQVNETKIPVHGGDTLPNDMPYDSVFFENYGVNPFVDTEDDHLSTFGVDVDNASYVIARRYLNDGNLPNKDSVRTEEFLNYFDYDYTPPKKGAFNVDLDMALNEFGKNTYLMRIGIQGQVIAKEDRKPAVLTFVIDVSGSMRRENRIGLVKKALRLLVDELDERDKIGIVIYGSNAKVLMEHKSIENKKQILKAIDQLEARGSTYAEKGIRLGYELALKYYEPGFINRVILCSDGVANVGRTGADDILKEISFYVKKGITLSAIGVGMGNYNDVLLEKLGNKGNGYYAYMDTLEEANKIFVDNLTGTLQVIAFDTKVQVDFNPEVVRSYRLLGYENRDIADNKFRDDKEDAGEVGGGHSVTVLYEVKLWKDKPGKIATVYLRYKEPVTRTEVIEENFSISTGELIKSFNRAPYNMKLAACVAQFAEILKKSYWAKDEKLAHIIEIMNTIPKKFRNEKEIKEFIELVKKADKITK